MPAQKPNPKPTPRSVEAILDEARMLLAEAETKVLRREQAGIEIPPTWTNKLNRLSMRLNQLDETAKLPLKRPRSVEEFQERLDGAEKLSEELLTQLKAQNLNISGMLATIGALATQAGFEVAFSGDRPKFLQLELPEGQITFRVPACREAYLRELLSPSDRAWDGHTTKVKSERIEAYARRICGSQLAS